MLDADAVIKKWVGPMPIGTQLLKKWVGPDPEKRIASTPTGVVRNVNWGAPLPCPLPLFFFPSPLPSPPSFNGGPGV